MSHCQLEHAGSLSIDRFGSVIVSYLTLQALRSLISRLSNATAMDEARLRMGEGGYGVWDWREACSGPECTTGRRYSGQTRTRSLGQSAALEVA